MARFLPLAPNSGLTFWTCLLARFLFAVDSLGTVSSNLSPIAARFFRPAFWENKSLLFSLFNNFMT